MGQEDEICNKALDSSCAELNCSDEIAVSRRRLNERKEALEGKGTQDCTPEIHFGRIASGDLVMKSGVHRDKVAKEEKVVAFEMEGAGTWDHFPTVVVKAACDYADSHKNKRWQPYAAASAAACMKALLNEWRPSGRLADPRPTSSIISDEDRRCIRAWRLTDPRDDKARILSNTNPLEKGSCDWVFNNPAFSEWWQEDEAYVLWIHGDPGKGKTMIMTALIDEISRRMRDSSNHEILAFFFCQDSVKDLRDAVAVIRGLVFHLVSQQPILTCHLLKSYAEAGDSLFEGLNALHSLWRVLLEVVKDERIPTVCLMVDALDECDVFQMKTFLSLLTKDRSDLCGKLKWVLTSRNEPFMIENLRNGNFGHDVSLEYNSSYVSGAVNSFIESQSKDLATRKGYDQNLQSFVKTYLVEHAKGTFLWVALVCMELAKVKKWKTYRVLQEFPAGLQPLYSQMMVRLEDYQDAADAEMCKRILCTVALAARPLCLEELGLFTDLPDGLSEDSSALEELVSSCGSFLTIQERVVCFIHQSVKYYLTSAKGYNIFSSVKARLHYQFALRLVRHMARHWQKDICGLNASVNFKIEAKESKIDQPLPLYIEYACRYWVSHFFSSGSGLACDEFMYFLQDHLLHWIEALSSLNKLRMCGYLVNVLKHRARAAHSDCHKFLEDASQFISDNWQMIQRSPHQVHSTAIIVSPESVLRKFFKNEFSGPWKLLPRRDASLWTCHIEVVAIAAISPDGRLAATGSSDSSLKLWDVETGTCYRTLAIESEVVIGIDFSPNGQLMVSRTRGSAKIWDTGSGSCRQILGDVRGDRNTIVFSPDSQLVAADSKFCGLVVWNMRNGSCRQILRDPRGYGNTITFSSNSQLMISASRDGAEIWDTRSVSCRQILSDPQRHGIFIFFFPDSQLVAASSEFCGLVIWDPRNGSYRRVLGGQIATATIIAVSPNKQMIAARSVLREVIICDLEDVSCWQVRDWREPSTAQLAFSTDNKYLAIGRSDTDRLGITPGSRFERWRLYDIQARSYLHLQHPRELGIPLCFDINRSDITIDLDTQVIGTNVYHRNEKPKQSGGVFGFRDDDWLCSDQQDILHRSGQVTYLESQGNLYFYGPRSRSELEKVFVRAQRAG
ncbi:WD40 repeat-like protein [Viridothelium virens]|uniref:WD40 repeat-like protein n=1 Tax=Viridothelium virens TaxID=1048519 RepID=A0A6A6GRU9_VIRVR|nr:WD40 repeat-like protein [Viridothelium virens]